MTPPDTSAGPHRKATQPHRPAGANPDRRE
nr:MAG TPA: hypothetical protein [Caudoviricetes sp.]